MTSFMGSMIALHAGRNRAFGCLVVSALLAGSMLVPLPALAFMPNADGLLPEPLLESVQFRGNNQSGGFRGGDVFRSQTPRPPPGRPPDSGPPPRRPDGGGLGPRPWGPRPWGPRPWGPRPWGQGPFIDPDYNPRPRPPILVDDDDEYVPRPRRRPRPVITNRSSGGVPNAGLHRPSQPAPYPDHVLLHARPQKRHRLCQ
jgi:hypothetical protein